MSPFVPWCCGPSCTGIIHVLSMVTLPLYAYDMRIYYWDNLVLLMAIPVFKQLQRCIYKQAICIAFFLCQCCDMCRPMIWEKLTQYSPSLLHFNSLIIHHSNANSFMHYQDFSLTKWITLCLSWSDSFIIFQCDIMQSLWCMHNIYIIYVTGSPGW